jgi:hypothetical protein
MNVGSATPGYLRALGARFLVAAISKKAIQKRSSFDRPRPRPEDHYDPTEVGG